MARGGHKQGRVIQHTGLYKDAPYIILEEEVMEKELGKINLFDTLYFRHGKCVSNLYV